MKLLNIQTAIFLLTFFIVNFATAQEQTQKVVYEKIIMVKENNPKNTPKQVKTSTQKDRISAIKVMIDRIKMPIEKKKSTSLMLLKKRNNDDLSIAFKALEVNLNAIKMSDFQFAMAANYPKTNDSEGDLGVSLKEITATNNGETIKQVKIEQVFQSSAAEEAGLKAGDIITAVDGKKVKSLSQLTHLIKSNEAGETIIIDYIRNGQFEQTKATLKKSDIKNAILFNDNSGIEWNDKGEITWKGDESFKIKLPILNNKGEMGVTFGEVTKEGVIITHIEAQSAAETAGLQVGDIITVIDGQVISKPKHIINVLEGRKQGETLDLEYLRGGILSKTKVVLKKNNDTFLFKSDEHEIKLKDGNFEWIEDENNISMGVLLGETTAEGVKIKGTIENSGAAEAGLEKGDLITAINGEAVRTTEAIKTSLEGKQTGDIVRVTYIRNEETKTVEVFLGTKKMSIRKPKDIDIIFDKKQPTGKTDETDESKGKESKNVETPIVSENNRLEFTELDMYPNPNQGAFHLNFEIDPGATTIIILDVNDLEIYRNEMPDFNGVFSNRIDISQHPSGTYFLHITQSDKKIIKKIVVSKE